MADQENQNDLLALTANIVSSHVSNNPVSGDGLNKLIREVYETLSTVGGPSETKSERPEPAVPIKKSVTPDYVITCQLTTRWSPPIMRSSAPGWLVKSG
jgi:predicted transcriptional regulator